MILAADLVLMFHLVWSECFFKSFFLYESNESVAQLNRLPCHEWFHQTRCFRMTFVVFYHGICGDVWFSHYLYVIVVCFCHLCYIVYMPFFYECTVSEWEVSIHTVMKAFVVVMYECICVCSSLPQCIAVGLSACAISIIGWKCQEANKAPVWHWVLSHRNAMYICLVAWVPSGQCVMFWCWWD